jgi:pimeloyl-ACP methyl ester carboxylesterase
MALHGSTAGWMVSPVEPTAMRQVPLGFLLERGFTVVVPLRRGRAESGGTYVEECAYQMGKCSLAEYRTASEAGVADAVASTDAVFEQFVLAKLKPRTVLLLGLSRGGFIALHFAALHPQQVQGVIAVSPGLLSVSDSWPEEENATRVSLMRKMVARVGETYRGPTLWIYAARDPFYRDSFPRQLFSSFHAAGGRGEYVSIDKHSLPNGHVPPFDLWRPAGERFLQSIESGR